MGDLRSPVRFTANPTPLANTNSGGFHGTMASPFVSRSSSMALARRGCRLWSASSVGSRVLRPTLRPEDP